MNNMRLDKFMADVHIGTRKEVKEMIRDGRVAVDGRVVYRADWHIHPERAKVTLDGNLLVYARFRYYMLYKPEGVISATKDGLTKTVIELMEGVHTEKLFPVGRLDKDTSGLLLITDDGELSHALTAPARRIDKVYEVHIKYPLTPSSLRDLSEGVDIGDETKTLPAVVSTRGTDDDGNPVIHLTIREGRFHQIKRMMHAVGNEVLMLKRLSMGTLILDEELKPGQFRELKSDEVRSLKALTT